MVMKSMGEWMWEERANNNNFYDLFFIIIFLEKHGFPIFKFFSSHFNATLGSFETRLMR